MEEECDADSSVSMIRCPVSIIQGITVSDMDAPGEPVRILVQRRSHESVCSEPRSENKEFRERIELLDKLIFVGLSIVVVLVWVCVFMSVSGGSNFTFVPPATKRMKHAAKCKPKQQRSASQSRFSDDYRILLELNCSGKLDHLITAEGRSLKDPSFWMKIARLFDQEYKQYTKENKHELRDAKHNPKRKELLEDQVLALKQAKKMFEFQSVCEKNNPERYLLVQESIKYYSKITMPPRNMSGEEIRKELTGRIGALEEIVEGLQSITDRPVKELG